MAVKSELILELKAVKTNTDKSLNDLIKKLGAVDKGLKKTGTRASRATNKIRGGFKKANKAVFKFAKKWGTLMGGAGFVGVMYKAVKASGEFQKSMAEVNTLLGKDGPAKMKKFDKAIKDLASRSSSTANELSKGLYQVISAGTKGTETAAGSMKLLEAAQKAAVAGVSDVFSSVDLLTTSLNAYQEGSDKATYFSDILFKTVKLGKINFDQLAAGMGTVASAAAGAGITFEEVNAALAAMTAGGVPPRRAITSLSAIMRVASKGSKELTDAFGETSDSVLRRDGLVGVMQKLRDVTDGDTISMQKLNIEQEAITGLSVLASSGIEKFKSALVEMKDATGATEIAYQKMAGTFDEQTKMFWNKLNVMLIEIGSEVMPVLLSAMESFGEWVDGNKDEIVTTFTDIFNVVVEFGKYILKYGDDIAVAFAAIWLASLGPIGKLVAFVGIAYKAITDLIQIIDDAIDSYDEMILDKIDKSIDKWKGKTGDDFTMKIFTPEERKEMISPSKKKPKKTIRSKEQEAAAKKALAERRAALNALYTLEKANAEKMQQIEMQYFKDREAWEKRGSLSKEERKHALKVLGEKFEKDLTAEELANEKKVAAARDKMYAAHLKKMKAAYTEEILPAVKTGAQWREQAWKGQDALDQYREFRASQMAAAQAKHGKPEDEEGGIGGALATIGIGALEKIGEVGISWAMEIGATLLQGKEATQEMVNGLVDMISGLAENLDEAVEYLVSEGVPDIINALIENAPKIIDAVIKGAFRISIAVIRMIPGIVKALLTEILPALVVSLGEAIIDALKSVFGWFDSGPITEETRQKMMELEKRRVLKGGEKTDMGSLRAFQFAPTKHTGGIIESVSSFRNAIRAHDGMIVPGLKSGEVPAILKAGEGVIQESVMSAMGGESAINAINAGKSVGGTTIVNNNVNLSPEHLMAEDTPKIVDRMLSHLQEIGGGGFAGTLQNTGVVEKAAEGFQKVK